LLQLEEEKQISRLPYVPPPTTLTPEEIDSLSEGESELSRYEIPDLAKQLTLVEHELFCAIRPEELLGQAWTKKNKERDSPNILRVIGHFNKVCFSSPHPLFPSLHLFIYFSFTLVR
jgi:RasGEF domain